MGGCCLSSHINEVVPLNVVKDDAASWDGPTGAVQAALRPFLEAPKGATGVMATLSGLITSAFCPSQKPGVQIPFSPSIVPLANLDACKIVQNLVECLEYALRPSVAILEEMREEEEHNDGTKAVISLSDAVKDVGEAMAFPCQGYELLCDSSSSVTLSSATTAGLSVLQWLAAAWSSAQFQARRPAGISQLPASAFHVDALDKVFAVCFPAICDPSEGMATVQEVQKRVGKFRQLLSTLGVISPDAGTGAGDLFTGLPLAALGATAKSQLMYAETLVLGQSRLVLSPIDREHVMDSLFNKLSQGGIFKGTKPKSNPKGTPLFYKCFPFFKAGEGSVEAGEGHGPRKELFDLAAAELLREWESPQQVINVTATAQDGCSVIIISTHSHSPRPSSLAHFKPGIRLVLREEISSMEYRAMVLNVDAQEAALQYMSFSESRGTDTDHPVLALQMDSPLPFTAAGLPVFFQLPSVPLLKCDPTWSSPYCWFNPNIQSLYNHEETSEKLQWRCCLAGWLAAQAIANGVSFPLPLPTAFFRFLLTPKGEYQITETEIEDIDPTTTSTFLKVRGMPQAEFYALLEAEDIDGKISKEDWIRSTITTVFTADYMVEAMGWFQAGFFSTGIRRSHIFQGLEIHDVQAVVVGCMDDGECDFDFRSEYRIVTEADFTKFPHNHIYLETLLEVANSLNKDHQPGTPNLKRLLLKFITGRTRLPGRKGEEVIRIELPYNTMTSQQYDLVMDRLPQAHTCNNTLELPNYCEGLLFGTQSWWFVNKKWLTEPQNMNHVYVTDLERMAVWGKLPDEEKEKVKVALYDIILRRLIVAVLNTSGYDLDEMQASEPSSAVRSSRGMSISEPPVSRLPFQGVSHARGSAENLPASGDELPS